MSAQSHFPQPATQTRANYELYRLSPYILPRALIEAGLTVKKACADTNFRLGYLGEEQAATMARQISGLLAMDDVALAEMFPVDAYQGGAGTAFNMNLNDAICHGTNLDPLAHANLHQSTNDVVPTALRLMLQRKFVELETALTLLQERYQQLEQRFSALPGLARTQLRDAQVFRFGQHFASRAQAFARDRWRCFKSRERIKRINLGGTAVGTGAGAPGDYVDAVSHVFREHVDFPLSRSEDCIEATSNYDDVTEAMAAVRICAQNLKVAANDIRLLAAGPAGGIGELVLPAPVKGSSIMAGKINPVVAEAVIQIAYRIMANDGMLASLASSTELQLNAFFPLIAHSCHESLDLCIAAVTQLGDYALALDVDREVIAENIARSHGEQLNLVAVFGYENVEWLLDACRANNHSLRSELETTECFTQDELDGLFSLEALCGRISTNPDGHEFASRLKAWREGLLGDDGDRP